MIGILDLVDAVRLTARALPRSMPLRKSSFVLWRAVLAPRETAAWMRLLQSRVAGQDVRSAPLDMVQKLNRSYVRHGLSAREKYALLAGHYRIAERQLPPDLSDALWRSESLEICHLSARDCDIAVVISRAVETRQEGEITVEVRDASDGLRLAKTTFLFIGSPEEPTLVIGGLQGLPPGHDKKRLVTATRRLSGLRPKVIALAAVQAIARRLDAPLLAIARAHHPVNEKTRDYQSRFHADYDAFWEERGGRPEPRFGYVLPVDTPRVDPAANAPDRRKAAFLVQLDEAVGSVLFSGRPAEHDEPRFASEGLLIAAE